MDKSLKTIPINESDLKKIQKIEFETLKIVHEICVKHNIKYFLVSGSLLGAVRHNGFIPWDDDLDIGIFREDYNKFIEIAKKELGDEYEFVSLYDSQYRKLPYAKVYKLNTPYFQLTEPLEDIYNKGVFIDVFPFDKVSANNIKTATRKVKIRKYIYGVFTTLLYQRREPTSLKYKILNFFFALFSDAKIEQFAFKTLTKDLKKECKFCTSYGSGYGPIKEILPIDFYLPLKNIQFEGASINIPNNSHEILKKIYGDYLKLPPVEERKNRNHDFVKVVASQKGVCND